MFIFYLGQLSQVLLPVVDLRLKLSVAGLYFLVLVVLVVKMVSKDGYEFAVGKIVEAAYKVVSDLDVKETTLLNHFKLGLY